VYAYSLGFAEHTGVRIAEGPDVAGRRRARLEFGHNGGSGGRVPVENNRVEEVRVSRGWGRAIELAKGWRHKDAGYGEGAARLNELTTGEDHVTFLLIILTDQLHWR
jgi:hypothetical protein